MYTKLLCIGPVLEKESKQTVCKLSLIDKRPESQKSSSPQCRLGSMSLEEDILSVLGKEHYDLIQTD